MCQQHDFSVRELEGIMMTVRLPLVDLLEARHPVLEASGEYEPNFALYLFLKRKFRARKQTNGYAWVIFGSETARDRMGKTRRDEPVAYLRRARCDEF
jgi:hypothetical protein